MDATKDYYAVLGVLPSVESTALKAVFYALLKTYHPDIAGQTEFAEQRTKEINEAFSILGNENKRREYDYTRTKQAKRSGNFSEESSEETNDDDLTDRWKYVIEYYPSTNTHWIHLNSISASLGFTYKITVLENRIAGTEHSVTLANRMKKEYLSRYFGSSQTIQDFAEGILRQGRRDIALELNKTIDVLGTPPDEKAKDVVDILCRKFGVNKFGFKDGWSHEKPLFKDTEAEGFDRNRRASGGNSNGIPSSEGRGCLTGFVALLGMAGFAYLFLQAH